KEQVIQEMDHALAVIPGIEVSFSQPIRDNVLESISQIDGQVVIKVFGDDPALLRVTVQQVLEHVAAVRGVARAFIDRAGEVADSRLGAGSMNISREAGRRVAAVSVFIRGRDMGSVVRDMQDRVKRIALPAGYNVTWSGEFENQQRAMKRLLFIVPITVFLI